MGKNKRKIISGKRIFGETKEKNLDDKVEEKLRTETQSQVATTTNIQSIVDNLHADAEVAAGVKDDFNKIIEKKLTEQLQKKDQECEAAVSKALKELQEAQERFKKEICEKEEYREAVVSDKKNLEASVLKLSEEIRAISADFQVASKAWELEKIELTTEIVAARKASEEMFIQNERVLVQYMAENVELESALSESKAKYQELTHKIVEDRHLWDSEKGNLESKFDELQRRLDSMANERVLLNHQNRELSTEAESLKAQLNESNATAARLEDHISSLTAAKMFLEKENNTLRTEMDKRTLASDERKVGQLETALDSVQKDLDSSMPTILEKERNKDIAEENKWLEEKISSLCSNVSEPATVSLEELNAPLQQKASELEKSLHSLYLDLESKDVQLRDLVNMESCTQYGNEDGLREIPKVPNTTRAKTTKPVVEKRTPSTTKQVVEDRIPDTRKPVGEKLPPNIPKASTTKSVMENETPNTTNTKRGVMPKRTINHTKSNTAKQGKENRTPTPYTKKTVVEKQTVNIAKSNSTKTLLQNRTPNTRNPVVENRTPNTINPVEENRTPNTSNPVVKNQTRSTRNPGVEKRTTWR